MLSDKARLINCTLGFRIASHLNQYRRLLLQHLSEVARAGAVFSAIFNCLRDVSEAFFGSAGVGQGETINEKYLRREKGIVGAVGALQDVVSALDVLQALLGPRGASQESTQAQLRFHGIDVVVSI